MSEIIALKLITGEEVVGEVKETLDKTKIIMLKPRTITIMRSPDGRQGLGLVPFSMSNIDATVEFSPEHVIAKLEPMKQVSDVYLQETSGIQLASSVPNPPPSLVKP
jgi:hypothetical protein